MSETQAKPAGYLFTSEWVSAGHPDRCADLISDAVVNHVISHDPNARVGCETLFAGRNLVLGGEIKAESSAVVGLNNPSSLQELIRNLMADTIGYHGAYPYADQESINCNTVSIQNFINPQSSDISQGVDRSVTEIGAGDQGIMFGFSTNETTNNMPITLHLAEEIGRQIYGLSFGWIQLALRQFPGYFLAQNVLDRRDGALPIGLDIKTQVTLKWASQADFRAGRAPVGIDTVVVSAPITRDIQENPQAHEYFIKQLTAIVYDVLEGIDADLAATLSKSGKLLINPTGSYVNHSALHDAGLTGRKLIVNTYGGAAPIGGGAMSGKDGSKVDRSAAYMARWIANQIVRSGAATKAVVQLSYAIGVAAPVSISVQLDGDHPRSYYDELGARISAYVQENAPLTPYQMIKTLHLDHVVENPTEQEGINYVWIAKHGHFGLSWLPWEKDTLTNYVDGTTYNMIDGIKAIVEDLKASSEVEAAPVV